MPDSSSAKTCRIESLAEQANAYPRFAPLACRLLNLASCAPRDVEALFDQTDGTIGRFDVHGYLRVRRHVSRQNRRNVTLRQHKRRADPDRPGQFLPELIGAVVSSLRSLYRSRGLLVETPPRLGERQRSSRAVKQSRVGSGYHRYIFRLSSFGSIRRTVRCIGIAFRSADPAANDQSHRISTTGSAVATLTIVSDAQFQPSAASQGRQTHCPIAAATYLEWLAKRSLVCRPSWLQGPVRRPKQTREGLGPVWCSCERPQRMAKCEHGVIA